MPAPISASCRNLTHAQTDYLLTYPEESGFNAQQEAEFLRQKTESADEIELLAEIGGEIVGSAGIGCVARKEKTRHRAEFGISVDKAYWDLGIGRALTEACIECAGSAREEQQETVMRLELGSLLFLTCRKASFSRSLTPHRKLTIFNGCCGRVLTTERIGHPLSVKPLLFRQTVSI